MAGGAGPALPGVRSGVRHARSPQPAARWRAGPLRAVAMKSLKSRLWRQDAPGPTSPTSPTAVAGAVSSACDRDPGDPPATPFTGGLGFPEGPRALSLLCLLRSNPFPSLSAERPHLCPSALPRCSLACPLRDRCPRYLGPGGPCLPRAAPRGLRTRLALRLPALPEFGDVCPPLRLSLGRSGSQPSWARTGISKADKAPLVFDLGDGEVG